MRATDEHLYRAVVSEHVPTVRLLLDTGLRADSPHLLRRATKHSAKLVVLLLEHGAEPDAASLSKLRMVQALLAAGADVERTDGAGRRARDHAAGKNRDRILALL